MSIAHKLFCNAFAAEERDSSLQLTLAIHPALRFMVRVFLKARFRLAAISDRDCSGSQVTLRREEKETVSLVYYDTCELKRWTHLDSLSFRASFYSTESLKETDDLLIVVVSCKVASEATNAAFHPLAAKRCLPVEYAAIRYLEGNVNSSDFSPRVVTEKEVLQMGIAEGDLPNLPTVPVSDPMLLYIVDTVRIRSYVLCGGIYRLVVSCD